MRKRKVSFWALILVIALICGWGLRSETYGDGPSAEPKLRIGTYVSQAVAIAYYRSELFNKQMADFKAESEKAKAEGRIDEARKLSGKSQALQKQAHRQVFGREPVGDILAYIEDDLPQIARDAAVQAIAGNVSYHGPGVQTVDITDALVQQFNPSAETLESIKNFRSHMPAGGNK